MTGAELEAVVATVQDASKVQPGVVSMMEWLNRDRSLYISEHPEEFDNQRESDCYMSDWVANFEISDFLRAASADAVVRGADVSGGGGLFHFWRNIERSEDVKNE
jgi:hypothetical protein